MRMCLVNGRTTESQSRRGWSIPMPVSIWWPWWNTALFLSFPLSRELVIWDAATGSSRLKLIIVSSETVQAGYSDQSISIVSVLVSVRNRTRVEWCAAGWIRSGEIVTRDVGFRSKTLLLFFFLFQPNGNVSWTAFFPSNVITLSITGLMSIGAPKIPMLCSRATRSTCSIWLDPNCPLACWSYTTVSLTDVG